MMKHGPSSSSGGDLSNVDHASSGTADEDDDENEDDDLEDEYNDGEDCKPPPHMPIATDVSASETSPLGSWHHGSVSGGVRLPGDSPRPGSQSMHHQLGYQQQQQPQQHQTAPQHRHHGDGTSPSPPYANRNTLESIHSSSSGMQQCVNGWLPLGDRAGFGNFQQHPSFYGNEFAPTSGYSASPPTQHQSLFPPYNWYSSAVGPAQQSVAAQQTLLT